MNPERALASLGKRLGGALIDGLILMVIAIPVTLLIIWAGGMPYSASSRSRFWTIALIISFLIFFSIQSYLLHSRGQTIGKVIVKTKIVDLQGNKPDIETLISLRYLVLGLLSFTPIFPILGSFIGLIDIFFIFREDHRCLHDLLAGTLVVDV